MSLLLAWQVKEKHCLVIGGGDVGLSRVQHLVRAGAKITVVSGGTLHPELKLLHEQNKLHRLEERNYENEDLVMYEKEPLVKDFRDIEEADYSAIQAKVVDEHFACVCCCIDDAILSTKIYYQCKHLRIPVNIADKPPMCDFYFGLMFNQDSLQIMISTNGKSPRLSKMIKDDIARQFGNIKLNDAIDNLGAVRARLRKKLSGEDVETIDARMQWIKKLTDFFSLRQWSELELSDSAVDKVVEQYPGFPPTDYEEFKKFVEKQQDENGVLE